MCINIEMHNFFKLTHKFQSLPDVRAFLHEPAQLWREVGYGFSVLKIPAHVIKDDVFNEIIATFNITPVVLRTPAKFWYKWHIDTDRAAAINVELYSENSHTVYGVPTDIENRIDIEELIYEEGAAYLLNTQSSHSILNLGPERYVMSLGFRSPNTYESIREFIVRENI